MNILRVKYCFSSVRVRFLHKLEYQPTLSHLRNYLYSYLFAKNQNGQTVTFYDESNLKDPKLNAGELDSHLKWLGVFPEEKESAPVMMNQYQPEYLQHLKTLISSGAVYLCFCGKNLKTYDGECRELTNELIQKMLKAKLPYKVRLKQPDSSLKYKDLVYGEQEEYPREDPVVQEPGKGIATQFKAVVADHIQNVTHIFHSSDNLPELNQYLTISSVLFDKHPTIISLPPLLSTSVRSLTLERLRQQEYEPAAVLNFVGLLGWKPFGDSVSNLLNQTRDYLFELDDLIKYFDIDKITKQPITYQPNKLKTLNKLHLKKDISSNLGNKKEGVQEFRSRLNGLFGDDVMDTFSDEYLKKSLALISNQIKKWSELKNYSFLFLPTFQRNKPKIDPEMEIKINNNLVLILKHLIPPEEFSRSSFGEKMSEFLQDFRKEVSPEEFYRYLKYCICGQPNMKLSALDMAEVLGHQEILSRVELCNPEAARLEV